jgi:N-acetyl-anhydromuramyl-L-alanine amidase AmpD
VRIPGLPYVQGRNSYTDGDGRKYGIAIHNTSNDASDEAEASYATRRTDGTSSHLYVDHDSVTQSLSLRARAGHAGSSTGNDNAYSVEITGGNGKSRAWWLANVAWDKLGAALAWMIRNDPDLAGFQVRRASVAEMRADPRVKAFYGHDDMRQAWGGTTHTDPGPNFPWDRLFAAVNAALGTTNTTEDDDMAGVGWKDQDEATKMAFRLTAAYADIRNTLIPLLKQIASQVNVDQDEIDRIAAAIVIPPSASPEDIAAAVVAELGAQGPDEAAQALVSVLGLDRAAQLAQALAEVVSAGQQQG